MRDHSMVRRWANHLAVLCSSAVLTAGLVSCQPMGAIRDVVVVANAVSGTVTFIDGRNYENLGSINIIPDIAERMTEINADPTWKAVYGVVKQRQTLHHREPGQGAAAGDRFIDDLSISPDGLTMYVSRGNLADAVAIDLADPDHPIKWRTRIGLKADHATMSADGRRFVVSSTVTHTVMVLDTANGSLVGSFVSGYYPHQNDYSGDGTRIYNTSIGDVNSPYAQNATKGARQITVVDATTLLPIRIYPFEYGIRPSVFTAGEQIMYAQLSYLSGVVKYDMNSGTITSTLTLPASDVRNEIYPTFDDYPHDSAHHGLAMSGDGTRLCAGGTTDDYVAIISIPALTNERIVNNGGLLPYWATTSVDGNRCFVSNAGGGDVSVIDYATGTEVAKVPAGIYPSRSRIAKVRESILASLSDSAG